MKGSRRVVRRTRIGIFFRWVVLLSLCHLDPTVGSAPPALSQQVTENEIKAALAFKFPIYVTWPENAWNENAGSFRCCILGESPLTDLLMQFEGQALGEKRIRVERLSGIDAIGTCDMLFIGRLEEGDLPEIWRPSKHARISLTGRNLGGAHQEFTKYEVEQSLYFEVEIELDPR